MRQINHFRRAGLCLLLSAATAQAYSIEGYTDEMSYVAGDTISFSVSTASPTYRIEIIRSASTPLTVATVDGLPGVNRWESWTLEKKLWLGANWPVDYTMVVPDSRPPGSYYARFVTTDGTEHFKPFVIRTKVPGSQSRVLAVMNYNTRNAYDNWGGASLYDSWLDPTGRVDYVGFRRPWMKYDGRGWNFLGQHELHRLLEDQGFNPEYATEWDIHSIPNLLRAYDVVVFCSHHEYLTWENFDAIEEFHDGGGHLAFFSGNDFYWQIRYENEGHVLVCYKARALANDPMMEINPRLVTYYWREPPVSRPGEALQGICWNGAISDYYMENMIVQDGSHWLFAGTGLQTGDALGDHMARSETDWLGPASPSHVDILLYARRYLIEGLQRSCTFHNPTVPSGRERCRTNPSLRCVCGMVDRELPSFVDCAAIYYEDSPAYGFPNGHGGQVFSSGSEAGWCRGIMTSSVDYQKVRIATRNVIQHMLDAPRDCNTNGIEDATEIANCSPGDLSCTDCNGNGRPDECDIDRCPAGIRYCQDCDNNGVLDGCQPDCDGDGVADACAILSCAPGDVACADCNTNSVPDACDIADCAGSPDCGDCNANAVPDACDIAACPPGDSSCDDCNVNGVPDTCEPDCNNNQIADACDIRDCDAQADWTCADCDNDAVPDGCQPDFDADNLIDACDPDTDNDGVPTATDICDRTPPGQQVRPDGSSIADINVDCSIDLLDFGVLQLCFEASSVREGAANCLLADVNGDGKVNAADFIILQEALTGPGTRGTNPETTRAVSNHL